jgi:nucleoid-associated protein YgaU
MTVANDIASGLSKMKSGAQGAFDKVSKVAAPITAGLDTVLEQVPAMLVCFVSPKVPVPFASIPIMFNPEKLKFSKQSKWLKTKTAKRNAPTSRFGGGEAERFNLKLFLDSSKAGVLGVAGYIWILKQLMKAPPILLDQPPLVMFVWGLTTSPMSYIEKIDYEFTLFAPSGRPLQAEVELTLMEYDMDWKKLLPLNPTSRSEARKTWVVTEGQTLDWIAFQEYGDPAAWRHIAQVNKLRNPMVLKPGQILKLTPLE